jgi:hypothetical protein
MSLLLNTTNNPLLVKWELRLYTNTRDYLGKTTQLWLYFGRYWSFQVIGVDNMGSTDEL